MNPMATYVCLRHNTSTTRGEQLARPVLDNIEKDMNLCSMLQYNMLLEDIPYHDSRDDTYRELFFVLHEVI